MQWRAHLGPIILSLCCVAAFVNADPVPEKVKALMFTPPEGWGYADPGKLPPSVKVMVLGKSGGRFPPSINLGTEPYTGTLKEYLRIVKAINDSQNSEWKSLGSIHTKAGRASLSQVDMSTSWGPVRLMHVILVREGTAYIMTSAAARDEFPRFYKQFFNSMRSLRFDEVSPDEITDFTALRSKEGGVSSG